MTMTKAGAPKHIAIYLHTLYNGGVERVMFNLIQGFLDRGIAVDLVLDFLDYSPFVKLLPVGTKVVDLKVKKSAERLTKLMGYLRAEKPEAMLAATHFANEIACVACALVSPKTRLILSEHTNLSSDIRDSKGRARRMLLPLTTRWVYPMADAIVAVSDGVADDMCGVSGLARKRVQTVYNPIDYASLAMMAKEPVDNPWFAMGEPPVIVAIGRLEVQKNFPNLLRAFAELRKTQVLRLVILGEGSERAHLTALIAEMGLGSDVAMPGFVGNPAAYIARAAVFAMSSSWEGMPVALIEALALGTPIVSTDCPSGPREILDGGKYGELVAMDDSAALAVAMRRVLDGARKPVEDTWLAKWDADTITERYLELMTA